MLSDLDFHACNVCTNQKHLWSSKVCFCQEVTMCIGNALSRHYGRVPCALACWRDWQFIFNTLLFCSMMESFSPVLSFPPLFPVQNMCNYFSQWTFFNLWMLRTWGIGAGNNHNSGGNVQQKCYVGIWTELWQKKMKLDNRILTCKNVAAALAHMPCMHAYLFVLEIHFRL